mgnify:CR=1 FL=1
MLPSSPWRRASCVGHLGSKCGDTESVAHGLTIEFVTEDEIHHQRIAIQILAESILHRTMKLAETTLELTQTGIRLGTTQIADGEVSFGQGSEDPRAMVDDFPRRASNPLGVLLGALLQLPAGRPVRLVMIHF